MRANALALWPGKRHLPLLRKDVKWLISAAASDGSYTYTSAGGKAAETYDNSNSQMAVLGVWAGAGRGVRVPNQYWRRIERFWIAQQANDGGWGYRKRKGPRNAKTYGSMTAAGLATLYICFDNLHHKDFIHCAGSEEYKPIRDGLKWLNKHYDALDNPKLEANWFYYWLFCLERVGLASGRRHFAGRDWYADGVAELLRRRNDDGSWGYGDRVSETAFALMFLSRGQSPVLLNKLQYTGKWNARPRDCANFTRWLGGDFERQANWQVVDIDSPVADWRDAPILYISGAGPVTMNDKQINKLRTFILRGGMIVSEAACNSGDFTLDMIRIYKKLFPAYPLAQLPAAHPIYSVQFKPERPPALSAVSNGVRLFAVHSPQELSLALQLGPGKAQIPSFHLLANVYLFATDKKLLRRRPAGGWPKAADFKPAATIRVARIKYKGNFDPEPLAWRRLALLMASSHRIRLEVSEPMDITALDVSKWPIAAMTGTDAFTLSPAEKAALKKYLAAGGSLVADAAGGNKTFADSLAEHVLPLAGEGKRGLVATDVLLAGPAGGGKVAYRRDLAMALGPQRNQPRIQGVSVGGRLVIILSGDDLTGGLVGYPCYKLKGYSPDSAVRLMTNILCHLAGVKLTSSSK